MAIQIDTNVAIAARDGDNRIIMLIRNAADAVVMSVVTRVELEGGVNRLVDDASRRRAGLDLMLAGIPVLPFDDTAADCYRDIIAHTGYSRRKLLDRMIAAQALANHAVLATLNAADFNDIPGLVVADWT